MRYARLILAVVLFIGTQLPGTHLAAQDTATSEKPAKNDRDGTGADESKIESTRLTLQVLTEESKKPVPDAHVVVRFVVGRLLRRDKRTSWEAKTNRKGIVVLDDVPLGTVQVQVIAKGFQTYGDEHELKNAEEEVTLLLKPPRGQVSAY